MGDNISIIQALTITAFSMIVVFLVLIVISILISELKKIGKEKIIKTSKGSDKVLEEDQGDIIDDKELVAVIYAAITASMGIGIPELNIKKIKRVAQTTPAWATASRGEQISRKL